MITITKYLEKVFEKFKEECDKGTVSMKELKDGMDSIKGNNPRLGPNGESIYSNSTVQRLYLLKYAYEYGFEYLSMCNELIEDFKDKAEISVVSLGCGTMLDYWALAYMLDKKNMSKPVVKYQGIDVVEWEHSLETEARARDMVKLFPDTFEEFFNKQDNKFNTHDVYFFPKSISEFSDEKEKSDIGVLLENLSNIEKDSIYFCITLRKKKEVGGGDVRTVQKIIDKLEEPESGFCVKELKCITDTENTIEVLKEKGLKKIEALQKKEGLQNKDILIRLGANHKISDTDIAKSLNYDNISNEDPVNNYIKALSKKCKNNSKEDLCNGCEESDCPCKMREEQRMTNTKFICDLIIKFEKRGCHDSKC